MVKREYIRNVLNNKPELKRLRIQLRNYSTSAGIEKDIVKENYLKSKGIKVIRFENKWVYEDISWCQRKLKRSLTTPDFMLRIKLVPSLKRRGNFTNCLQMCNWQYTTKIKNIHPVIIFLTHPQPSHLPSYYSHLTTPY